MFKLPNISHLLRVSHTITNTVNIYKKTKMQKQTNNQPGTYSALLTSQKRKKPQIMK